MKPTLIERCPKCGKVTRLRFPTMPDFDSFKKYHGKGYEQCDCKKVRP